MNKDNYKSAMSGIRHSEDLTERIIDMTEKKKRTPLLYKRLAATALALVLFLGGGFGINMFLNKNNNISKNGVSNGTDSNYFVMNVYAAEGDEGQIINDIDELTLPSIKLKRYYGENGVDSVEGSIESLFSVSGKNIASVRYQCETSEFEVYDLSLKKYLVQKGEYYDIIVPYSHEYKTKYGENNYEAIMYNHIKNGDYDQYFTRVQRKSVESYKCVDFIYNENEVDENGDEKIIGLGLVSKETFDLVAAGINSETGEYTTVKDYTFKNYLNETEHFAQNLWKPNYELLLDGKTAYDELPHDTVTITVTFNDGSVQKKSYDLSFNKKGELVIKQI